MLYSPNFLLQYLKHYNLSVSGSETRRFHEAINTFPKKIAHLVSYLHLKIINSADVPLIV